MAKKKPAPKPKAKAKAKPKRKPPSKPQVEGFRSRKTAAQQQRFLAALAETGNITAACAACGMVRTYHYRWLRESEDYRRQFDEAFRNTAAFLEEEAVRRAVQGSRRDVYYQGIKCGEELVYSDTLLIFLLKGMKPGTYRERHDVTVSKPDDELNRELAAALAELAARTQGGDALSDPGATGAGAGWVLSASTLSETATVPGAQLS